MPPDRKGGKESLMHNFRVHWYGSAPVVALFADAMVEKRADLETNRNSRYLGMLLYNMLHFGRWSRRLPAQKDFSLPIFSASSKDRSVSVATSLSVFLQELEEMVVSEIESGGKPQNPSFSTEGLGKTVGVLSELAKSTADAQLTLVLRRRFYGLVIEEMHVPDYDISLVNPHN